MPAGVAVFGAERRAESVDLRQRAAVRLDVQLAADRQKGFPAEKILREVEAAVRRAGSVRQVDEIERADAEHLAGTLGVARRDDRRMHPEEPALVIVAMDGHAERVPHARDRAYRVRARTEMRHFAQILERGLLRL